MESSWCSENFVSATMNVSESVSCSACSILDRVDFVKRIVSSRVPS